jgi:hypothetical protein
MTLLSFNTFGARVWTDGKQVAPSLPRPPAVVKCHHCAKCYWLADAEKIGTVDPWSNKEQRVDPAWAAAQEVQEPVEEEYYQALEKGLAADPRQERDLRVLAWWRRNDRFRDGAPAQSAEAALPTTCRKEDEGSRLMKAEVLRELGEFESAKQVLSRVASAQFSAVVGQLRSLCDRGDAWVRELHFGR